MTLVRIFSALLLLLGLANPAAAQWAVNGLEAAENPWRKIDGGFGAMLMITDKAESFLEQWSRPAAPGYVPHLSPADSANRGETVTALILFSGCTATPSGNCQTVADFKVIRPDGSIYAEHQSAPIWEEAPPAKGRLQVGIAQLQFLVEADDPLGDYLIEAQVRDLAGLRGVAISRSLIVLPVSTDASEPAR